MKAIQMFFLIAACYSCKSSTQLINGKYYKNGKDYKHTLIIGKDSIFTLSKSYLETTSICKGSWTYLSKDTILLKCFDEQFPAQISGGYMNDREKKVIVLKGNKLMLGNLILKHKN